MAPSLLTQALRLAPSRLTLPVVQLAAMYSPSLVWLFSSGWMNPNPTAQHAQTHVSKAPKERARQAERAIQTALRCIESWQASHAATVCTCRCKRGARPHQSPRKTRNARTRR